MLKRAIVISNPRRLSVSAGQLVITPVDGEGAKATVPIEDLAHVIIDNQQASITIPAINILASHNVGIIVCDARSMPSVMMNPMDCNELQGQRYRAQLDATLPAKKALWQQLVTGKIRNQSRLLTRQGHDGDCLKPYYRNVKSDDSDNREGAAARLYWSRLFDGDFVRTRGGAPPNNLLNYGYTILRAATARAIVAAGMWPALGIHHHNRSNAYPLADDLMEPFRPFVDDIVLDLWKSEKLELNRETKGILINVLYCDTMVKEKMHPLSVALEMLCISALRMLSGESKTLSLPSFPI